MVSLAREEPCSRKYVTISRVSTPDMAGTPSLAHHSDRLSTAASIVSLYLDDGMVRTYSNGYSERRNQQRQCRRTCELLSIVQTQLWTTLLNVWRLEVLQESILIPIGRWYTIVAYERLRED